MILFYLLHIYNTTVQSVTEETGEKKLNDVKFMKGSHFMRYFLQ